MTLVLRYVLLSFHGKYCTRSSTRRRISRPLHPFRTCSGLWGGLSPFRALGLLGPAHLAVPLGPFHPLGPLASGALLTCALWPFGLLGPSGLLRLCPFEPFGTVVARSTTETRSERSPKAVFRSSRS